MVVESLGSGIGQSPGRILDLGGYFLPHVREVFDRNLFKYFLGSFLTLLSFWDPYNVNVVMCNALPEVSLAVFISFHSFLVQL